MSDHVYIFDTTLRDGEQSPGATMNLQEKLGLARQLESLGVDIIEAGFPAASQGDFEAVQAIAAEVKDVQVAALCRALEKDIDQASASEASMAERDDLMVKDEVGADDIAEKFGIESIPTTYLIGADGKIVANNLRGEALATKLGELLGEK